MLTDWIHWLSSVPPSELILLLAPLIFLDVVRYSCGSLGGWLCDISLDLYQFVCGEKSTSHQHCPSVCAIIACMNEADTIGHTLKSLWGSYPRLEIIVVDDGSHDGMAEVAQGFAREHDGVLVLRKPRRGGKSSALNFALPFTQADIIVGVDGDSHLVTDGIWEIVQPFADPKVGAVSGTVIARNPFTNLVTWLQALEFLRCIFLGRMFASKLGILSIVSGAFGAFRREAIQRVRGWDVGPGEDGDLVLRLRKGGYNIVFAPYAQCLTNLPRSWWQLIKQRRRWEWAVMTFECRKHIDMANIFSPNFRWSNFFLMVDRWLYNVVLLYAFWGYALWLSFHWHENMGNILLLYYLSYVALDVMQLGLILYYSNDRRRDAVIGLILPLMPFYHLMQRAVSLWAVTEEMLTRRSFQDSFVPEHVRQVTWHW